MVVIVTVLRNQEPVGLCGGWIPCSPGTEKPWPWSCLHNECWARVRLLPFSLSTCMFQADFASPECLQDIHIAYEIRFMFLGLVSKAFWSCSSLYSFPLMNSTPEDVLPADPHTFVHVILSANRKACLASCLLKTSLTGLVHGDPCLPFLCLSLFWPCWEFNPAS